MKCYCHSALICETQKPRKKKHENFDLDFTHLSIEVIEYIFCFLHISDLVSVCKSSKTLRSYVQNYSLHQVLSNARMDKVWDFMLNCRLLHFEEERIKSLLIGYGTPNLVNSLFFLKCVKSYGHWIQRYSVMKSDKCDFYGTYLAGFQKRLQNIPPGTYRVAVHFQLKEATTIWHALYRMDMKKHAYFRIMNENEHNNTSDSILMNIKMKPSYHRRLEADKFDSNALNGCAELTKSNNMFSNCAISHVCDVRMYGKWYFLKLTPFTINKRANLVFEWEDADRSCRSFQMCWDYIQIERI